MLRRVALARTDVSEERNASISVTRIGELGTVRRFLVTANVVPNSPILVTLIMEAICYSEMSVLTRATRRNIPEDAILHNDRRENIKSYIALTGWALQRRRNVSPVRYELSFYNPEDGILHYVSKKSKAIPVTGRGGL
jgi:hypothetical protein